MQKFLKFCFVPTLNSLQFKYSTSFFYFLNSYVSLYYNIYLKYNREYTVNNFMTAISSKLGINLKRIRTTKNLSQDDIGRKLGLHRAYISGVEHGKRNPTLATIEKIAVVLGVSADELLK